MNLSELKVMGFDRSYHIPFTKTFQVGCSKCQALCINGIPTHETGCVNERIALIETASYKEGEID